MMYIVLFKAGFKSSSAYIQLFFSPCLSIVYLWKNKEQILKLICLFLRTHYALQNYAVTFHHMPSVHVWINRTIFISNHFEERFCSRICIVGLLKLCVYCRVMCTHTENNVDVIYQMQGIKVMPYLYSP